MKMWYAMVAGKVLESYDEKTDTHFEITLTPIVEKKKTSAALVHIQRDISHKNTSPTKKLKEYSTTPGDDAGSIDQGAAPGAGRDGQKDEALRSEADGQRSRI